jgi:N-acetylglucosamine-6-phosphate deacetylase
MPIAVPVNGHGINGHASAKGIIKFTNCLLAKGDDLVNEDLWVSTVTGKILNGQEILYGERVPPDDIIDLGGRILAPGLIDVQLNGAFGFDFSVIPDGGSEPYSKGLARVNRSLITTGVTSYLPTLTSQRPEVYHKVKSIKLSPKVCSLDSNITQALPFLGPSGYSRDPNTGSESLGAHCEGPFLSPTKNGCHSISVLQNPTSGLSSLESCYGASNLRPSSSSPNIKLVTLAPELPGAQAAITALAALNIIPSIGHSEATYEQALCSISSGAKMITHLFNAMKPLHHRNPGIFGLLGTNTPPSPTPTAHSKPYYGIIADGIHLHPTSIKIAFHAHPAGLILVSDAMPLAGMPDGVYDWTNGSRIVKQGALLTLEEDSERIAGSSISLIDCVSNFMNWTGVEPGTALRAATETPARMLGLEGVKGVLKEGADADLCVLDLRGGGAVGGEKKFVVEQVWKFGRRVYERDE